jgi:hypothetical protein
MPVAPCLLLPDLEQAGNATNWDHSAEFADYPASIDCIGC